MILDQTSGAIQQLSTTLGVNAWTWSTQSAPLEFRAEKVNIFGSEKRVQRLGATARDTTFHTEQRNTHWTGTQR